MEHAIDVEEAFKDAVRFKAETPAEDYIEKTRAPNELDGLYDQQFAEWVLIPSLYEGTVFDRLNLGQIDVLVRLRSGKLIGIEEKVTNRHTTCPLSNKPALLLELEHRTKEDVFIEPGFFLKPRHPLSKVLVQYDSVKRHATFWDRDRLHDSEHWDYPEWVYPDKERIEHLVYYGSLEPFRNRTTKNRKKDSHFILIPQSWVKRCLIKDFRFKSSWAKYISS